MMEKKKISLKRFNAEVQKVEHDESKFLINYKNILNPAQFDAVTQTEGTYLIIAGAGTGKTHTLVYRVARLIEMGVEPKSILLLTFTRKAANQMMNRASIILDDRCSKISGGTFHSYANIVLRKYAQTVGLDNGFTILDQSDSEDVINLIRSQEGFLAKDKRFPNKQTLFSVISFSVNTGKSIEDIIKVDYPHFEDVIEKIYSVANIYDLYKKKNNLLDYDDLLVYLRNFLLDLSPAAKNFLKDVKYVMVDEYQDTNNLQADIVRGLAQLNNNIMVVGDDSQAIYSFRGADFKNIMQFPDLFKNVKVIKLEENFRSKQPILDFANDISDASIFKYKKELYTRKTGGNLPVILATVNENMQSKFIVEKVLDLREEGVELKDIAVLFRSSFHSFDLEIELSKANIPFQKFGGMKFVETAHIKDILAFLRIASNPKDVVSWYRILLLHEGIGPKKAQKILDDLTNGKVSIYINPESLNNFNYGDNIFLLFELLFKIRTKNNTIPDKVQLALDYYYPIFKNKYDDFNKRVKDLEIFLTISEKYKSLDTLLSDMAIEPVIDSVVDIGEEENEKEFITLSTIHSAKGLEWHSVFIIDLVEGFFPSSRSADDIDALEEERRLMYVASTRAKENLFMIYPMHIFERWSGTSFSKPSRFISDIKQGLAEGWLLEE